ncbi:MAG: alpha/beta fold hydrolase, partial [Myxococcales bacterium]|nr:alpha/beta fold hydrolase [Myxococcales bacterium]
MTRRERLPAPSLPAFIEALLPPGIERYRVQLPGVAVHVMEIGAGRPVLMLHGNPTWGFLYRQVAGALLGAPLRLIMPDLPGLGLSEKPRKAEFHTLARHIDCFGALIDQLELEDLIFVGQDWGGAIGLGALARRAARLSGVVLLNTVVGPPRPGFRPTAFHRLARAPLISDVAFRLLGVPQRWLALVQGDRASIRGDVARAYRYPLRRIRDRVAPLALARMVPNSLQHPSVGPLRAIDEFLVGFRGPVSMVWGTRDPVLG